MELWWWIKPLFYSSFIWAIMFMIIASLFEKLDFFKIANCIYIIAAIPLLLELLSFILWVIIQIFYGIWSPYI